MHGKQSWFAYISPIRAIIWPGGRWFSGQGREFYLVCQQCFEAVKQHGTTPTLGQICWRCYHELVAPGNVGEIVGQPEVLTRSIGLSLVLQKKELTLPEGLLDIQPVDARQESVWIVLTHEGQLIEINLTTETQMLLWSLPESKLNLDAQVTLHIAPGGQYVAIVNTFEPHGLVLNLATGQATMRLERDDYCVDNCRFPFAFFEDGQRLLLIHGTRWNRLDIADPRTGESMTERVFEVRPGQKHPEHFLDYFHGNLSVSPDGQWVVDDGWFWRPYGLLIVWNIRRWVHENPWESEDGSSLLELCQRDDWDWPLCWVDERTVAGWGYGDEMLLPAVRLFDVVAEKELAWFAGPEGTLVYDEYLFALSKEHGLTAWDIATGERVLATPDFRPTRYHRSTKQFLHINRQQGKIQLGTLVSPA